MLKSENEKTNDDLCNLGYLIEMTNGKKQLINKIIDSYLTNVPEELKEINESILRFDYEKIRSLSHKIKSTVTIMGINSLVPILQEMEDLGGKAENIEKIKQLNQNLNLISMKAIEEVVKKRINFD